MTSAQELEPHSHRTGIESACAPASLRASICSLTSRNNASFRTMRDSRSPICRSECPNTHPAKPFNPAPRRGANGPNPPPRLSRAQSQPRSRKSGSRGGFFSGRGGDREECSPSGRMQLARAEARPRPEPFAVVCLSHLRWDFVWQRPQHLLSRFARERQVFFFEEPLPTDGPARSSCLRGRKASSSPCPTSPPAFRPSGRAQSRRDCSRSSSTSSHSSATCSGTTRRWRSRSRDG